MLLDVKEGARRRQPLALHEIVENGLCIGCGLCRSVAGGNRVALVMTAEGRERPVAARPLEPSTLERINAVCPGTRIAGPDPEGQERSALSDVVWGRAERLSIGHA